MGDGRLAVGAGVPVMVGNFVAGIFGLIALLAGVYAFYKGIESTIIFRPERGKYSVAIYISAALFLCTGAGYFFVSISG